MTSNTTAALEWAAQVSAAAIRTHKTGAPVIAARRARTLGALSAGASVSIRIWRDSSIRPRPIATRPRSRSGLRPPKLNANKPAKNRTGATAEMSNERACTINVVPMLAPSMTANAGTRSTRPRAAKDVISRPVAVLLCRSAVTPIPASQRQKSIAQRRTQHAPAVRSRRRARSRFGPCAGPTGAGQLPPSNQEEQYFPSSRAPRGDAAATPLPPDRHLRPGNPDLLVNFG